MYFCLFEMFVVVIFIVFVLKVVVDFCMVFVEMVVVYYGCL